MFPFDSPFLYISVQFEAQQIGHKKMLQFGIRYDPSPRQFGGNDYLISQATTFHSPTYSPFLIKAVRRNMSFTNAHIHSEISNSGTMEMQTRHTGIKMPKMLNLCTIIELQYTISDKNILMSLQVPYQITCVPFLKQGLSESEFYSDLVCMYMFRKSATRPQLL